MPCKGRTPVGESPRALVHLDTWHGPISHVYKSPHCLVVISFSSPENHHIHLFNNTRAYLIYLALSSLKHPLVDSYLFFHPTTTVFKMSGGGQPGGGFYKYRCKHFYTYECMNWVWVNHAACATCLVRLPIFFQSITCANLRRLWDGEKNQMSLYRPHASRYVYLGL